MLHGVSSPGRSISPKTAMPVVPVSGCALPAPGSSKSVALSWIRDRGHEELERFLLVLGACAEGDFMAWLSCGSKRW